MGIIHSRKKIVRPLSSIYREIDIINPYKYQSYDEYSKERIRWKCPKGHRWKCTIYKRTIHLKDCPICDSEFPLTIAQNRNQWLDCKESEDHARLLRGIELEGVGYVDAYDPYTNKIYLYFDDVLCGNPVVMEPDDINIATGLTYSQLLHRKIKLAAMGLREGYSIDCGFETPPSEWMDRIKSEIFRYSLSPLLISSQSLPLSIK